MNRTDMLVAPLLDSKNSLADWFAIATFIQGVPYYWAHFVFVIFSGSRAHTEELFIAIR